ncbi:hypothetical protein AKG08_14900 [Achromobacter piechaudii]|nr:hypothetical protein AKG08_14900 [Achromobacter piechaudii]
MIIPRAYIRRQASEAICLYASKLIHHDEAANTLEFSQVKFKDILFKELYGLVSFFFTSVTGILHNYADCF